MRAAERERERMKHQQAKVSAEKWEKFATDRKDRQDEAIEEGRAPARGHENEGVGRNKPVEKVVRESMESMSSVEAMDWTSLIERIMARNEQLDREGGNELVFMEQSAKLPGQDNVLWNVEWARERIERMDPQAKMAEIRRVVLEGGEVFLAQERAGWMAMRPYLEYLVFNGEMEEWAPTLEWYTWWLEEKTRVIGDGEGSTATF